MGGSISYQEQQVSQGKNKLLGTDLLFPIQVNAKGDLALTDGIPNLEQAMQDILEDMQGEVIYNEDMGGDLWKKVHKAPCNQVTANEIAAISQEQIMIHEKRAKWCTVVGVPMARTEASEKDKILLTVRYEDIYYSIKENFVYPFLLTRE
jgi:phage baseplate assembly protein W